MVNFIRLLEGAECFERVRKNLKKHLTNERRYDKVNESLNGDRELYLVN